MKKLMLASLLMLAACANEQWYWHKADMSSFQRDDYLCQRDAYIAGGTLYQGFGIYDRVPNTELYVRCMNVAGYELRRQG